MGESGDGQNSAVSEQLCLVESHGLKSVCLKKVSSSNKNKIRKKQSSSSEKIRACLRDLSWKAVEGTHLTRSLRGFLGPLGHNNSPEASSLGPIWVQVLSPPDGVGAIASCW